MTDKKSIYELGLHESMQVTTDTTVMRVAGGWIYTTLAVSRGGNKVHLEQMNQVFVPYHKEFNPDRSKKHNPPPLPDTGGIIRKGW